MKKNINNIIAGLMLSLIVISLYPYTLFGISSFRDLIINILIMAIPIYFITCNFIPIIILAIHFAYRNKISLIPVLVQSFLGILSIFLFRAFTLTLHGSETVCNIFLVLEVIIIIVNIVGYFIKSKYKES